MHRPSALPAEQELRSQLIKTAREFSRVTKMSRTQIGLLALNDSSFLFRIEKGATFTLKSYTKLRRFFVRHWPRDTVPAE